MKRFDPDSKCVKCGATGAATRHIEDETLEVYEIMARTCQCCDYAWYELPLDSAVMETEE